MDYQVVISTSNLKLKNGVQFSIFGYFLTQAANFIDYIYPDESEALQRGIKIGTIKQAPFFYSHGSGPGTAFRVYRMNEYERLKLEFYTFCLWFSKDNSCNIKTFYRTMEGKLEEGKSVESFYFNCYGLSEESTFDDEELREASEIFLKLQKVSAIKDDWGRAQPSEAIDTENYNVTNRIDRAIKFLQTCRATTFLPLKIALYMSIFECLFSSGTDEITHQVAERAAIYLTDDPAERLTIYDFVKDSYGIRSKYIHGSHNLLGEKKPKNTKNATEKLKIFVKDIDSLTRRILKKAIMEDAHIFCDDDELPKRLKRLIFLGKEAFN